MQAKAAAKKRKLTVPKLISIIEITENKTGSIIDFGPSNFSSFSLSFRASELPENHTVLKVLAKQINNYFLENKESENGKK